MVWVFLYAEITMGLSFSHRAALVYHHQNDIVLLVLEIMRSGPGFSKLSLDESPVPRSTVHCNAMLHEGPETGACGDPSTSALGLVCQLRTGPDQQTVL